MRTNKITIWLGVITIAASGALLILQQRASRPGQLVPKSSVIEWDGFKEAASNLNRVHATFVLENRGGKPLRILNLESGCGCLKASVNASVIIPGRQALVEAEATPFPVGERTVPITLTTDSTLTPVVILTLRMIGGHSPPFLIAATGDLAYLDDPHEEKRELLAVTVEKKGEPSLPPVVRCDLDFFRFPLVKTEEGPYSAPTAIKRIYTFGVVAERPVRESFVGEVIITDPWNNVRVERLRVTGSRRPAVRVFPTTLTLNLKGTSTEGRTPEAVFRVLTQDEAYDPVVEPEHGATSPLTVERVGQDSKRIASFVVKPKRREDLVGGVYNLIVRSSHAGAEKLVLPVTLARSGENE